MTRSLCLCATIVVVGLAGNGRADDRPSLARSWLMGTRRLPSGPERPPRWPTIDSAVLRTQDEGLLPPLPAASVPVGALGPVQPITMQYALYGTLNSNPDLLALRQNEPASAEAVEVARRFPVALNPVLWVEARPLVYARNHDQKDGYMYFSLRQPIELGHQTRYREAIARAALDAQHWVIVQAELQGLVQTYRFFQTAAYRRDKLKVARQIADFNERLVRALRAGLEAGSVLPADLALAEVELSALKQQVEVARQDYENALADLRNQIGAPATVTAEPLGEFILPNTIPELEDQALIDIALNSRPEVFAAKARVDGARAGIGLARGDVIPTPVVGPVYTRNEGGINFYGFVYITPIPILNSGRPLVRQREAELRQAVVALEQVQQKTITQVRATVTKWNNARKLISETDRLVASLQPSIDRMERLFEENQADLARLLQARQRLIQVENARLDAYWQATQAQADLLAALGAPNMIGALLNRVEQDAAGR